MAPSSQELEPPANPARFNCDDVFTSEHDARLHFGREEGATPACQIKSNENGRVAALRQAENEASEAWMAIHNETTDAARAYHAQAARHRQQLTTIEQVGYDRGLADAKAHPETLGITPTLSGKAEAVPVGALYLIRKGGAYYRPNSQGYTRVVAEAGRYTFEEAEAITHPNGPDGPRDGMDYVPAPALPSTHTAAGAGPVGEAVAWEDFVALRIKALEEGARSAKKDFAIEELAFVLKFAPRRAARPVEEPSEVERDEAPQTDGGFLTKGERAAIDKLGEATALRRELAETRKRLEKVADGNRPLPYGRDELGRFVRDAWIRWAQTQPNPKPSWLLAYDELPEPDKEADRQIGETIARWTLIGDAARTALTGDAQEAGR